MSCADLANPVAWPSVPRARYHQQYLSDAKNPYGYCPDHGTGVSCPVGVVKSSGPVGPINAEG